MSESVSLGSLPTEYVTWTIVNRGQMEGKLTVVCWIITLVKFYASKIIADLLRGDIAKVMVDAKSGTLMLQQW